MIFFAYGICVCALLDKNPDMRKKGSAEREVKWL
jgi:hypothetical protein